MNNKVLNYIKNVLENIPNDWVRLTTHRLDIYKEELAKVEFLEQFEALYLANNYNSTELSRLPTAYDYIRLGHPLSSVLEWAIAKLNHIKSENVICFSSNTMPILAVLRKNALENKPTNIFYTQHLPNAFNEDLLKRVYGYQFELIKVDNIKDIPAKNVTSILISEEKSVANVSLPPNVDFLVSIHQNLGSIILVNEETPEAYISEIQHVRRRESIAMTPSNCFLALQQLVNQSTSKETRKTEENKAIIYHTIKEVTGSETKPLIGSSGLSIQYAIMMGLVDDALEKHKGKNIKFIVPPNCYGGTNDQARRVAACINNVEIVDLPVDRDHNMVESIDLILTQTAKEDAISYIIAEIPTNPRVEVPDLKELKAVLSKKRKTKDGNGAVDPVFILDQTFCPNVKFVSKDGILSSVKTISYVSGSKFPSGGKCTAGYCVANDEAKNLMEKIERHLILCDNEATPLQIELLAEQLPSMNERIEKAYINTRDFVNFIRKTLPEAKINFVSEELAEQGFTPSVFSLDLPTKGNTHEERETYKRALNQKLIDMMISQIPNESKYCVSYGQLKGCYWTIPATSTQGTTKEDDKDYIARVSVSPNLDLDKHKKVFSDFVNDITN